MSKNVKVNDVNYSGVSKVQLNTIDGGTALFKDVDEIVTPSGSVTITENGLHDVTNYAKALVDVASGGSTNIERGTFVGDDSREVNIPVNGLKSNVCIITDGYSEIKADTESADCSLILFYANHEFIDCAAWYHKSSKEYHKLEIYTGTVDYVNDVTFSDDKISIGAVTVGIGAMFRSNRTYTWIAW